MGNLALLLLLFFSAVSAAAKPPNRKWILRGRPWHGLRPPRDVAPDSDVSSTLESYFKQKLDHFNKTDSVSWKQRFWYNSGNYNPQNGINFMMIGGEGPESAYEVTDTETPFHKWGKELGAGLWCLEHRFYGRSQPFPTQTTENLKFLHSRQALADLANFIQTMNVQYNITNPKWIVFGGSYPGALTLWFRELYPELTVGAVGSSGPVQAQMDFYEYLQVCEASIRSYSNKCADEVGKGFKEMVKLMNTKTGRDQLTTLFTLKPALNDLPLSYNDIQNFYSIIFGHFQSAVQYNRVGGRYLTGGSIPDLCKFMEVDDRDPVQKLADMNVYATKFENRAETFDYTANNFTDEIVGLQDVTYDNLDAAATRSWIWQTCNEFGFFQSTDIGENIFGSVAPVNQDIIMCEKVFGLDVDYINRKVNETLKMYGGRDNYNATNVVIPNGSLDPWHALGTYQSTDPSVVPFLINGTAHCADMEPTTDIDPPGLAVVRKLIFENIKKWVGFSINSKIKNPFGSTKAPVEYLKNAFAPVSEHKYSATDKAQEEDLRENFLKLGRRVRLGRPMSGLLPDPPAHDDADTEKLVVGQILQDVDHFDLQNPDRFAQNFWLNERWYKPGGPIFLMIGGEGPATAKWVTNPNLPYLTWAKQHNAAVYQLEHRFYGGSQPTVNQSTDNLRWLTSEQMLADLAVFIQTMNVKRGYVNPKWITFGGSYSGAMSAWMREKYPELVIGAVGSSGPVFAKVDFFEYLQVVESAISGYSQSCADAIATGFQYLHNLILKSTGRKELSETFKLNPSWDENSLLTEKDFQNFFQNVYSAFQGAVQYSGDNNGVYANGYGIKETCEIMLDREHTATQNLARVVRYVNNITELDNSYMDTVNGVKNISFHSSWASTRSWTWQTCNEFGYYQTTDNGQSLFGSPVPVNFFIDLCTDVFGPAINRNYIDKAVRRTLKYYGGRDNYRGTNVVLPNGSNDPWHALGKLTSDDSSVVPYLINGTAHCADMYPARAQDKPGLAIVRQLISDNIEKWINNSPPGQSTSTSSAVPDNKSTVSPSGKSTTPPTKGTVSPGTKMTTKPKSAAQVIGSAVLLLLVSFLQLN